MPFVRIFHAWDNSDEKVEKLSDSVHQATIGIRAADVIINLMETGRENGSFGNGLAQFATD